MLGPPRPSKAAATPHTVHDAYAQGASKGLAGLGKFPTDEQLLDAARALSR